MKIKNFVLHGLIAFCLLGMTSCNAVRPDTNPPSTGGDSTTDPTPNQPQYDLVKVDNLIKIGQDLENNTETTEKYYCKGIVEKIDNPSKNAITFKDETGSIFCYRVNGKTTIQPALKVGEELIMQGTVKKYNDKPQFNYPQIIERDVEIEPPLTEDECQAMTIEQARNAASGTKIKISGVVAIITRTQEYEINGFYLIDETGSIFIHSKELGAKIQKGNKITILGKRDNYLGTSETNAHKQGYLGAIQVINPVLISNDNKNTNEYDTSWIKETTIKEMIDTPLSNNITSKFYKVKTFVKKSSDNNNDIIILNDIDNYTGAIIYSCNKANDFSWLKPYDGKLVELYVAAHNVKVTDSSYNYRLQPLEKVTVLDNFSLTDEQKADYVATYHVSKQFRKEYTSDPEIELMTTFNEDLWGISNASISYTSDNENVIKIENNILHCLNNGTANVKANVTVNGQTIGKSFAISFSKIDISTALTVKQAIDAALDSKVKVRGIVSSKVANKNAIYITDETGTIAVSLKTNEYLKDLHIGDEVYFEGTRQFRQPDKEKIGGQSHIYDSTLLINKYGNHPISKASYVNSSLAELKQMQEDSDHTTTVYTIKVSVKRTNGDYSTDTTITDGTNSLLLYSGGANDYKWLEQFVGKGEVEAHVMLCDWNQKGLKGAVLSISDNNKTTYNDNGLAK